TRFSRDWSSDVCSSDLLILSVDADQIGLQTENLQIQLKRQTELTAEALASERQLAAELRMAESEWQTSRELAMDGAETEQNVQRSEERRVGKERRARCA